MLEFLPSSLGAATATEPAPTSEASTPANDRGAGSAPAKPRLVFKRSDDALVPPERWTREQRIAQALYRLESQVMPLLKAGKTSAAIIELVREQTAASIAHHELIDRLEDRLAELEADARRV